MNVQLEIRHGSHLVTMRRREVHAPSVVARAMVVMSLPCALLSACGGGGDGGPAANAASPPALSCVPPPEGAAAPIGPVVVGGTIPGRVDPSFVLVAPDREGMLLFYGPDLSTESKLTGYIYAGPQAGCSPPASITYNGKDVLRGESVYLRPLLTTGTPLAVSGTIRYPGATYSLTGGPIPGSTYDAAAVAKLDDLEGSWPLNSFGQRATVSVNSSGKISGSFGTCPFTGTAVPQERINLFRLKLVFENRTCDANTLPRDGFAVAMPLNSGETALLLWAKLPCDDCDWFDPFLAIGRR